MDAVVSSQGLSLPKRMLRGMRSVHIQKKQGVITITPKSIADPILGLGSSPSDYPLKQGSKSHDQTIYSGH